MSGIGPLAEPVAPPGIVFDRRPAWGKAFSEEVICEIV
jgi:hypothetical protein